MCCKELVVQRAFVLFSQDPKRVAPVDDFWGGRLDPALLADYIARGKLPYYHWLKTDTAATVVWELRDIERTLWAARAVCGLRVDS